MGKIDPSLKLLATWYQRQKRVLPWREEPTPYRVWVSEIMLQQTQVAAVLPFFERFMNRFRDVNALAEAPLDDVLLAWAGLGYYSRARNLWAAAKIVARQGFPTTRDAWCELPGIGPYTAGAIASISQNQVAPILDGNVERVISRYRGVGRSLGDAHFKRRLWRLSLFSVERAKKLGIEPRDHNQSLMELGALVCTPRQPQCPRCPLARTCRALERGQVCMYPPAKKKKEWIAVFEERFLVVDPEQRILVSRNAEGQWRAGLWDLVTSMPAGAKPKASFETKHVVTRHKITRKTTLVELAQSQLKTSVPREDLNHQWISYGEPVAATAALARVLKKAAETGWFTAKES